MKWLLITTIARNPGDDWIRIGIQNVIREVDPHREYILLDKESPSMRKTLVRFDKCIWCGMPVFWSHGENQNCRMPWWQELMLGWPSERKNDFMVLGAGSFFPLGRELETISHKQQLIQSAEDVLKRSYFVTARDEIVSKVTGKPIPHMICPAVFSILDYRKSHELKLANLMPHGGHYTSFGPQEANIWNEKKYKIAKILRENDFVFAAHSLAELQFAQKCGWKKIIPFNGDPYGLLEHYGRCGKYFGNRVHGAISARGNNADVWSVGYDSRQEAVRLSGARVSKPSELDIDQIADWACRDIEAEPFDMESNFKKHVDIVRGFMFAGSKPLSDKLNLGCGLDYLEGFVNVDGDSNLPNVDYVLEIKPGVLLEKFGQRSFNYILAKDFLEHHFHWEARGLLKDFHALLGRNGRLELSVPNIENIINDSNKGTAEKALWLYGGQDIQPDTQAKARSSARQKHPEYFCHKYGWTPDNIKSELLSAGFSSVEIIDDGWNMKVAAQKKDEKTDLLAAPEPLDARLNAFELFSEHQPTSFSSDRRKILLVRPDSIGDFVLFSGVLEYFKDIYEGTEIHILVQEHIAELAQSCPYIDEVITFNRNKMISDQAYSDSIIEGLKSRKFDIAIYPVYSRDEIGDFLTLNSGADIKIASKGDELNIPLEKKLENDNVYTGLIPTRDEPMLETARNIEFVSNLLLKDIDRQCIPKVWIEQQDEVAVDKLLSDLQAENPIVVCPFSQHAIKDWPLWKWVQLIHKYKDYPIVICGSEKNKNQADGLIKLLDHNNVHNLCGRITLRQLASLLKRSRLCLGADTGSIHIAVAVGCPQVVIAGGGHFGRFIPYSPSTTLVYLPMKCYQCNWLCKYRQGYCITQIRVETVDKAVRQVLNTPGTVSTEPVLVEETVNRDFVSAKPHTLDSDSLSDSDSLTEADIEIEEIDKDSKYLVTAIVSTYNSEQLIAGCLDDLENQTIADRLEIIVVDSGSQQNEQAIVKEFQKRYDNIKYIRTENRETVYTAWNRAIKIASGKYITNANTDDRHTKDAFEVMVRTLEKNPDIAMVYSDQDWVEEVDGKLIREAIAPEFSRLRLLSGDSYIGSNPMWRKEIHEEFGYFDGDLLFACGDWEFWLRITQKYDLLAINENLGTRRYSPDCLSYANLLGERSGIAHHDIQLIFKCYHYALETGTRVNHRGISGHPIFSKWPETRLLKKRMKAQLANEKIELIDNIKDKWDHRNDAVPKLSIVIATCNREDSLPRTLGALNEQTKKDFEVIVVNSGRGLSNSAKIAGQLNYSLCWIDLEDNFGPSFARNIGISTAKAEHVAFLYDDAVADTDFVKNICEHFSKNNICALRGKILPRNEEYSVFSPDYYDLGDKTIYSACETGTNCAFRKDVLVNAGGFDIDLFSYEFQELSYKLYISQDKRIDSMLYFPDVIVYNDYFSSSSEWFMKDLNDQIGRMTVKNKWIYHPGSEAYLELMRSPYPTEGDYEIRDYGKLISFAIVLEEKNPEIAMLWAEKAAAIVPDEVKSCYVLGSLYVRLGRYGQAQIALEKILEPLDTILAGNDSKFAGMDSDRRTRIADCLLNTYTKLAQCYMQTNQYHKLKQVYTNLLNNPNLILAEEQKADILNVLTKLDKTLPTSLIAEKKNNITVSAKSEQDYLVSAIVSTYNSEKFLKGCLDDLEHQTIADKLEIIVINSGSQENEEAIVREYQQKHNNIVYIETEQREGIYTAWNRAVKVARGTFLTNANTDDRHREDALEIMAETLLANPDVALAYGDQICTDTPNGTSTNHHAIEMARRAEYSHERLLFGCCVGSQPMWRKSLHNKLGYFDDTLTCAGDWDFWLRISISSRYKFKHIPEFLGLYYYNENGIEHGRKIHSLYERYIVGKRYGNPYISVIPLYTSKDNPLVSVIMPAYNAAEHIAEAIESVLIQNYRNFELIVVDDGSTDDTKDIVASFKDDKIKYLYKDNGGPSSARNLAINKAKGQYIMPLDADDMMTPDFIAKHLAEFEKHPDVDLVYCDVLLIGKNSDPIRIMNKPEYQDRRHLIRDLLRAGHPVVPFRLGIRRSVFDRIGFYDEDLLIGEDYDMMRRFVKAGLKEHHLSEPLHLRRMHADSLSGNQSAQKAKSHFEVIERFIDTFAYDELFPDVAWDQIAPQIRQLHAKCLTAGTYLAIGQDYVKTKATECSRTAFDLACSELNDCVKMDPGNQDLRQLLQKSKLIRARYTEAPQQVVSK